MTEASDEKKNSRRRGRKGKTIYADDSSNSFQTSTLIDLNENASAWYDYGKEMSGRNGTIYSDPPQITHRSNSDLVSKYRATADTVYQREIQSAGRNNIRHSDERWVENTMRKGTLKDRIAATSVMVTTDPVHKFYALDGLLSMAGCAESGGKSNSRVAQLSAQALEDLFINALLPKDRRLLSLSERPLYLYEPSRSGKNTQQTLSPRILLLWRFEEMIKSKYELFLRKYISHTLKEGVEMHKIAALQSAAALLIATPEGESQLLTMIVNKLGDPGKKTAAAAGHQLRMIMKTHPNMQLVIAREVQQLAHRPHLSAKALYNCIVFLNQLKLEKDHETTGQTRASGNLPASLIKTYFKLFEVASKGGKKSSKDSERGMKSRLLSALLTGVNRAHPYLPQNDQGMEEHVDALYRVVHTASPAASTQALMLLFHLAVGSTSEKTQENLLSELETARQDRFYRALYNSLIRPSVVSHGKHMTMFFNLLYKAMKHDSDSNRVNACAKRLMSAALHSNSASMAGSIFLLNEIANAHPSFRRCIEDVPTEYDACWILDDTKREPRAALVRVEGKEGATKHSGKCEGETSPPSWELALMSHHAHPSVSKFASTAGNIEYTGDPLKDFGLAQFLDKFAYRNPKNREKVAGQYRRGQSVAERKSGTENQIQSRLDLPMNDPTFLVKKDVNEQDKFFHTFFVERARRDEIKGISRKAESKDMAEDERETGENIAVEVAEENLDIGAKTFEEYEQAWDSDPEEDDFADSLAEQLMIDATDDQVEYDGEDPDMSDWVDVGESVPLDAVDRAVALYDSGKEQFIDSDEDDNSKERDSQTTGDEDDFMDDDSDSDDSTSIGIQTEDFPVFVDGELYRESAGAKPTESKRPAKRRRK
eukprot:scaffold7679_cov134-Cylindrotheca_fusiformis.AAC.4